MAYTIRTDVVLFNKSTARDVLNNTYKHQRKLSDLRLAPLVSAMREDTFDPTSVIMMASVGDDELMQCINGQHTMRAIVETDAEYALPVVYYICESEKDRQRLYVHIDRQGRRNLGDSIRAMDLTDEMGISSTEARKTVAALRFILGNWGVDRNAYAHYTDDKMLSIVTQFAIETRNFAECYRGLGRVDASLIHKRSTFALGLITFRYQPKIARGFWEPVATGENLTRNDPRYTLRRWLQERSQRISGKTTEPEHVVARAAILAWNAYFAKRDSLAFITVKNKTKTVQILGTAYTGYQDEDYLPVYEDFSL